MRPLPSYRVPSPGPRVGHGHPSTARLLSPDLKLCQGLLSPAPAPASLGTRPEQEGRAAAPAPGNASLPAATCPLCPLPQARLGWEWGRGLLRRQDAAWWAPPCHAFQNSALGMVLLPAPSLCTVIPGARPWPGAAWQGRVAAHPSPLLPSSPRLGERRWDVQHFSRCPERTGWEGLCVALAPAAH